jgi:glutathione S-transferase
MLSLSPKGTVPVLWLASEGSRVIEESLEIMLWALRLNDPLGWLSPTHASEQEVNELIQMNDQHFKYHLDRYKYPVRYGLDSGLHHRERALQVLRELNQRLEQRAYLAGSHFSLLDAALAPFVRQFAKTDLNWFKAQTPAFTKLINWLNGFEAMSAFEWVMRKNEGHSPLLPQHAST